MERYIGLDVHAASSTLALISESGRRLQTHVLETNGAALVEAIRLVPGRKHLVFEEGIQSAWLYEILSPHVDEAVVAGGTKSRGQNTGGMPTAWPRSFGRGPSASGSSRRRGSSRCSASRVGASGACRVEARVPPRT